MREKIESKLLEYSLTDAEASQLTDELLNLFNVSKCSCPKESTDFYDEYGNLVGWGCLECGFIGQ